MSRRSQILLGVAAFALALPGAWLDRPMFFAAWLAAWWLGLSVVLGALANRWVHALTGGQWGDALAPVTRALARRLPWLLLLFVPLLFGADAIYPWAAGSADPWRETMARPEFNRVWLDPMFVAGRVVAYALAWWLLARPAASATSDADESPGRAAAFLLVHAVVTSLAAVDLLMSLLPAWYSTGFALLVLAGQLVAGSALTIGVVARAGFASARPATPPPPPIWRDLGNLLLTWVLGWAYLAFMQLLIIWAENLPREITWYVPRLQTGWSAVGIGLVLFNFALPLLALLFRAIKDRPKRLAFVAFAILAGNALDVAWMVLPSVAPHSLNGWWLLPLLLAALGLVMFGGLAESARTVPARHGESLEHVRHAP
ncbi:MAG TPA: hypothetical protein VLD35_11230 [Caldimonas sp.]|nr:hypothetical protein [Caldimonas sp.]